MKDVIDVLAMQREKRNTLQKSITIDYTKSSDSFTVSRFIFECGMLTVVSYRCSIKVVAFLSYSTTKDFFGRRLKIRSSSINNSYCCNVIS